VKERGEVAATEKVSETGAAREVFPERKKANAKIIAPAGTSGLRDARNHLQGCSGGRDAESDAPLLHQEV